MSSPPGHEDSSVLKGGALPLVRLMEDGDRPLDSQRVVSCILMQVTLIDEHERLQPNTYVGWW